MDRIDFENILYARADWAGAQLYQKEGELFCLSQDAPLKRLIEVYNRFFKRQNALFLQTDALPEREECSAFNRIFEQEARRLGPCASNRAVLLRINETLDKI